MPPQLRADCRRDAHAVLFPAFADLNLDETLQAFLRNGGQSLLLGETRAEYVSRAMSVERRAAESGGDIAHLAGAARQASGRPMLLALDQELGGIQRLHGLVTPLPDAATAAAMTSDAIEAISARVASEARQLGITLFLSPIIDVVIGANPWLERRTLGTDPAQVARIAAAFVRGVRSAGVAAMAKHFPGHPVLPTDPALEQAHVRSSLAELTAGYAPWEAVIAAGVDAIMTGPAVIDAFDPVNAASTSPAIMRHLRQRFAFKGLIISDDLDAKAILQENTLGATAVAALAAGADLLLLAAGPHLDEIVEAITKADTDGQLAAGRLAEAAGQVRALAARLEQSTG